MKTRFDPYKNFKFRVKFEGRYVAGVSKAIPAATRADLEVSDYKLRLLGRIVNDARDRSVVRRTSRKNAVALFAGANGTGKTLAAEVIAAELGSHLYRVDL